jgi:iron complex outermembrane recepter protein
MVVMKSGATAHGAGSETGGKPRLTSIASVGAAVLVALYGLPAAEAQQQPQAATTPDTLKEVVVTATRRAQTVESVPYSLSVITPAALQNANITDLASLTQAVPGMSMYDFGARFAGGTTPTIRGLNADSEPRGFRTFEQSPVGMYVGNSPLSEGGYFQLDDLQRVEVLRGPQGTLYGAGALAGAIRFIPNPPELGVLSGELSAGSTETAHSSGTGYILSGVLNAPLGDTLAVRFSAQDDYEPGFINAFGLMRQSGPIPTAAPVLADPSDPVNSPAEFYDTKDWNFQKTFTGRASALWKPTERFSANLAYEYGDVTGAGGPQDNPVWSGGAYPIDPRITLPAGGPYRDFTTEDQPFERTTGLASLDLSYDAGFATISSTSSYFKTDGETINDDTDSFGAVSFIAYYAGVPTNPRYLDVQDFTDQAHSFSQEVRLVSAAGPTKPVDYTLGVYYEKSTRDGQWNVSDPGSYQRTVAQGCTASYFYGATFPDCLVQVGPNDTTFNQADAQSFHDESVYGELTWHFAAHGQITFGGRRYQESFTDLQTYTDYAFSSVIPGVAHSTSPSKNTWKVDPSYEYANQQYVYVLWSQGFRRGGANSVPLSGFLRESPELDTYAPDTVNNYEAGLKGRFPNGLTYDFDIFDDQWNKPQISGSTPIGNLVVFNGNTARSRGFEFESTGPLALPGLTYTISYAYADAVLSSNFSLPANNGSGVVLPGELTGTAGQQLPGSPKVSTAGTVTYQHSIAPGYGGSLSLSANYRSHTRVALSGGDSGLQTSAYTLLNLSATLTHDPWDLLFYVTNLTDKRAILAPPTALSPSDNPAFIPLSSDYIINRPREAGLRLFYSF